MEQIADAQHDKGLDTQTKYRDNTQIPAEDPAHVGLSHDKTNGQHGHRRQALIKAVNGIIQEIRQLHLREKHPYHTDDGRQYAGMRNRSLQGF
mgnify:CR=1 FL=1